ncbi:MAG: hypothetical protein IKY18_07715 [Oscillospiraceae bacterium]|nr:hypothetical protein [Oscillospiraceae bacterium]
MKIKLLSLLLAISMIAGFLPVTMVSAETSVTSASVPTSTPTSAPTTAATTVPTVAPTTKPATTPATTQVTTPTPAVTSPAATTLPTTTTPTTSAPTDVTDPTSGGISISVNLCENSTTQNYAVTLTAIKGGKAVYATTNDSGTPALVTGDAVPINKYVKLEYPQNGLPTITLMNTRLRSTGNALDLSFFDSPVKIVIAGDSTIESTNKNGIYRASYGDITIVGPKKLTMNCYNSAITFSGDPYTNSLTLKDLKLKATAYANTDGHTLQIPAGGLTVDKCDIELVNRAGVCVYLGQGNVSGYGSAAISNSVFSATSQNTAFKLGGNLAIFDSNVQFSSDTQALLCGRNLSANGSTLYMTGRSNAKETIDVRGDFTLHTSNAEIIGTRFAIFSSTTLPRTLGEYTAVAGITKEASASFNENLASAYQYYYAESLEQPTEPTEPTVSETDPTGSDPTGSDPTRTESTEPTLFPPAEPDSPAPTNTLSTLPTPTTPVNSTAKKSGTMFWILAALMALGACGAGAMAIMMFRRSVEEEYEDEFDEESEEIPAEETEEEPKKFSWEKFKKFFVKKSKEDILGDVDIEEEIRKELLEEPLQDIDEDELETIIKEFHDDPVEESEENAVEAPQEDIVEEPQEEIDEEPQEDIDETSIADIAEKPKGFSMEKFKKFFAKILDEVTKEDTDA